MEELPIIRSIFSYIEEKNKPFSMPGHKGGRGFHETPEGRELISNIIKGDITEVEGLDNLHKPSGIIKESQMLLSKLYGSRKSFFLVNGSTSGNLIMLFSSFNEGDKILVERNCHRSIYNGIIMRKLKPVYIKNTISKKFNAPFSIDMEHFLHLLNNEEDLKGVVITYPNYYGMCVDLKKVIEAAKERNLKVLVDSAHGAHFGICKGLPEHAVKIGADLVVMSAHKTLPSVTQTAYLHVNNDEDIDKVSFYTSIFSSTSPSYMFLASLEYAVFYMKHKGEEAFSKCIEDANLYRLKINKLKGIHVISRSDINNESGVHDIDETRFVINIEEGSNGHHLLHYLRNEGIQAEMSDESNVVLILSPFNIEEDYEALYKALNSYKGIKKDSGSRFIIEYKIPETKLQPHELLDKKKEKVKLQEAVGRVCALSIVPYPPGIPLIMAGESIDSESVNMIEYCLDNNMSILGVEDGYVEVIDSSEV